jgi:hypothetical protein
MQAPEVTVVLRASEYVTFERRQELFDEAVRLSTTSSKYGHVFREYKQMVSRKREQKLVKLVPVNGDCGVGERLESGVYRGLVAVLTEIGMMSVVSEEGEEGDGRIVIEPQKKWREAEVKDEEEGSDEENKDEVVQVDDSQKG